MAPLLIALMLLGAPSAPPPDPQVSISMDRLKQLSAMTDTLCKEAWEKQMAGQSGPEWLDERMQSMSMTLNDRAIMLNLCTAWVHGWASRGKSN